MDLAEVWLSTGAVVLLNAGVMALIALLGLGVKLSGVKSWVAKLAPRKQVFVTILVVAGLLIPVGFLLTVTQAVAPDLLGVVGTMVLTLLWIGTVLALFTPALERKRLDREPRPVIAPFIPSGPKGVGVKTLYEIAVQTRKLELTLSWQRGLLIWAFLGAIAVGYCLTGTAPMVRLLLAHVGAVVAVAWVLASRGSAYWQQNWEGMIRALEGPMGLFSHTLGAEPRGPLGPARFSAVRIMIFFSYTVMWSFVGLALWELASFYQLISPFLLVWLPLYTFLFAGTAVCFLVLDGQGE